ncbi:MAG: helix-turn-helix transcriptional regulator [Thiolinea sp.]
MFVLRQSDLFFVILLAVVALLTGYDLVADYLEGTDPLHLAVEALVVLTSVFGVAFLLREVILRQRQLDNVRQELSQAREKLSASREQIRFAGQQFMAAVQQQFQDWKLTPSESEVANLLLKGLSFEEIAKVRNTKEKTVRQQASAIYRKAGLNGRHEFAAWFFEDLLQ